MLDPNTHAMSAGEIFACSHACVATSIAIRTSAGARLRSRVGIIFGLGIDVCGGFEKQAELCFIKSLREGQSQKPGPSAPIPKI